VPLRPAIATVDLQQLALADQVANRHRLDAERLWLTAATGLIAVLHIFEKLGKARDQL
jgi:hypothetical protein